MDRGDDRVDQFMMSVFAKSGSVFDERIQATFYDEIYAFVRIFRCFTRSFIHLIFPSQRLYVRIYVCAQKRERDSYGHVHNMSITCP
ncbi:MAG: hypothetical protein XD88_1849 [Methanocalculus sp. 52_23]|nr:MAG: hypothetical protein XD88_1849 [Methanocalculus sp. 52_23]